MQVGIIIAFILASTQLAVKDDVVEALPDTVSLLKPWWVQAHLRVARPNALRANGSTDPSVPGRAELAAI